MRPCFGNFQPELVETLEKRRGRNDDSESIKNQDLIIGMPISCFKILPPGGNPLGQLTSI